MAGRGRLSSLDTMPEEGQEDIRWAYAELNKRQRTQTDILFELNDRLTAKGLEDYTISKSAFGRKSVAISRASARMQLQRDIYAGIAEHLTPENIAQGDIALAEFLKALIGETISEMEGDLSPKQINELSSALKNIVASTAVSTKRRQETEKEIAARVGEAAKEAGKIARKAGLSAATIDALKAQILGIRKEG